MAAEEGLEPTSGYEFKNSRSASFSDVQKSAYLSLLFALVVEYRKLLFPTVLQSCWNLVEKEFISLDDISGGELFLGLAESYQIKYIADAIKALKEQYPKLQYHITSGDSGLLGGDIPRR